MKKILLIATFLSIISSEAKFRLKVGIIGGAQMSMVKDSTNMSVHDIMDGISHTRAKTVVGKEVAAKPLFTDEKIGDLDSGVSAKASMLTDLRLLKLDHFSCGLLGQIGYSNIKGSKIIEHATVCINSNNLDSFIGGYAKYSFSHAIKAGIGYGVSFINLKYSGKLAKIDDIKKKMDNVSHTKDELNKEFCAETDLAIGHKVVGFFEYKHSKELSIILISDFLIGSAQVKRETINDIDYAKIFHNKNTTIEFKSVSVALGLLYKLV